MVLAGFFTKLASNSKDKATDVAAKFATNLLYPCGSCIFVLPVLTKNVSSYSFSVNGSVIRSLSFTMFSYFNFEMSVDAISEEVVTPFIVYDPPLPKVALNLYISFKIGESSNVVIFFISFL